MRRLSMLGVTTGARALVRPVILVLAMVVGIVSLAPGAGATGTQDGGAKDEGEDVGAVSVPQVSGLLDPITADFVERSITDAEAAGDRWVVFQVNSGGTVIDDDRLAEVVEAVRDASIDVGVWVGPSGSSAQEGMAQVAAVADAVGISPGSGLGDLGTPVVDDDDFRPAFVDALDRLRTGTVGAEAAQRLGLTEQPAPIIGRFLISLDGVATRVKDTDDGPRRAVAPASTPVFSKLALGDQLMHTVASPPVAYLLFILGMALLVFELYTAGVGVAGVVGAGCFVFGAYGLAVLPTRPLAIAALVVTFVAYAVDIQTGVPRVWTGVGTVALVAGSLWLYDGVSMSWVPLVIGIGAMVLFSLAAMPSMVRTRFSTPTIGRDWMVDATGEVVSDVDPEGVVRIQGALWRARTNRATPVRAGEGTRVVSVDGLLLEIEPLEGAARDHRDRSTS